MVSWTWGENLLKGIPAACRTHSCWNFLISSEDKEKWYLFVRGGQCHTAQCLNLLLGGSKKVGFQQKWCLTTPTDSLGYSKFKFYIWTYFWTYFGPFWGSEGQKTAKKSKLLIFHYFLCWKLFCTQFFAFYFSEWNTSYILRFFSLKMFH